MSDRVAIIGGSTVGRNHFPFPNRPSSTAGSTFNYQLRATLDQMCKWFYRVKRWTVTITVVASNPDSGDFGGEITLEVQDWSWTEGTNFSTKTATSFLSTREATWCVNGKDGVTLSFDDSPVGTYFPTGGDNGTYEAGSVVDDETYTSTSTPVSEHNIFFGYGIPLYVDADSKFTCEIVVAGNPSAETQYDNNPASLISPTAIGHFQIEGTNICVLYKNGADTRLTSVNINIAPLEYWPFALRNGSPVWDTSTGAQLNDPLADYDVGDIEETITAVPDLETPSTLVIHRNPSPWSAV